MPAAPLDLLVIGCGTAGAALARAAARAGLRVRALDKRPLDDAGARWLNGVPRGAFAEAGLPQPQGAELGGAGGPFHMIAGMGPQRVTLDGEDLLDVDMRHLVARLQRDARAAGAQLDGEAEVTAYADGSAGAALTLRSGERVEAPLVVDASGLGGLGARPAPRPPATELCVAAQAVFDVQDEIAAARFFIDRGMAVGDTAVFTGISGGYSIINARLDLDDPAGPALALLTGGIPGLGFASGITLQQRFLAEHPWIGARRFGGARAIPIGPPLGALVEGRLLRFGDAAGMVFAAHGSGIGLQLRAAADLAAHLAAGGAPQAWTARFHQRFGGGACAAVVFARLSAQLRAADLAALFESGLTSPPLLLRGLLQEPMRPAPAALPGLVWRAARSPRIVARLGPSLARMQALELHHLRVPSDPVAFGRWLRRRDALLGPAPVRPPGVAADGATPG
jgi:flavin-dependent dehydrogenase